MNGNGVLKLLIFVGCFYSSQQGLLDAPKTDDDLLYSSENDLKHTMQDLSLQLGKFNGNYLANMEQKIATILTTVSSLDSNVKNLQDKAQVFEIFRHHISHWTEHMKSMDQKLELLKRGQDQLLTQETKLSHLDFKVQHIFEKVDVLNEKLHDITKKMYAQSYRRPVATGGVMEAESNEVLSRLGAIQRQIQSSCKAPTLIKSQSASSLLASQQLMDKDDLFEIKEHLIRITAQLQKIPTKDLKQVIGTNRKIHRNLESLTELVRSVDERTIRIFDADAFQSRKMFSSCKNTEHEITTFTNSADLLLKRIENLVLGLEIKMGSKNGSRSEMPIGTTEKIVVTSEESQIIPLTTEASNIYRSSEASGDDIEEVTQAVAESSGSEESSTNDDEVALSEEGVDEQHNEFILPQKSGCHQVLTRKNGIYKFGMEYDLNDRDFYKRVCDFSTEGIGWTVIQNRESNEVHENFNRSWNEYKHGFGNLKKEFWFGNDYIHKLTYNDSCELRIELEDFNGNKKWAQYTIFQIASEKSNYNMMVSGYAGNANDSLSYHNDQDFSTYDRANDKSKDTCCPCARTYGSGWWYNNCSESNLNGRYFDTPLDHNFMGIIWEKWMGDYSLARTKMMIRPKELWFSNDEDELSPISPPDDP